MVANMIAENGVRRLCEMKPTVSALLMAVEITEESGQYTLKKIFNVLKPRQFPFTYTIHVYASFTSGRGDVPIQISLVDVDDEFPPLFVLQENIPFDDPLETREVAVKHKTQISRPGIYTLRVASGGDTLLERRLTVEDLQ
jgi:hypothetical protein